MRANCTVERDADYPHAARMKACVEHAPTWGLPQCSNLRALKLMPNICKHFYFLSSSAVEMLTTCVCCAQIMLNGFKVGGVDLPIQNGARFGHGVYTATGPDTPWKYAQDSQCVILARGLKGRSGKTDSPYFNSWSPQHDWLVFAAPAQLLPVYVIHLTELPSVKQQRSRSFTRVFRKK
eukprot:6175926-Pleurochrysis_carterae.AAC.1